MTIGSSKNLSAHWEGGARTRKEINADAKRNQPRLWRGWASEHSHLQKMSSYLI